MTTLLKRGSRGAAVRDLQILINRAVDGLALKVDGDFGPATEKAVLAAQQRLGLVMDGIAGRQTITALKAEAAPIKPGRAEPDKSAMAGPVITGSPPPDGSAYLPPNDDSLQLLTTARPISEIIVHCAATPEGKDFTVADIRAWHKQRGWSDIGYHYVVYRDGRIMSGRPVGQVGAHCAGHNTGTIGICYVGGLSADGKTAKDTRTPQQVASLLYLRNRLTGLHKGIRKISGHNEYAAKACPCFTVTTDPLSRLAA
ncbi:MAG: N-acetylmuramoyl-L-alanine amidase [Devosia sp.]|uniref:peptidoglycan recognition protein family protein n=1 Tax=Devosia sp. TaxID=1871048 RepID=UPI0024C945A1|nr:N-acetylmuramoyl-L-alanine amidase [Devosia sp.]UYN98346.1 MAG: N-acetylmuramoyl-L-alanine amidase [Devosia sp.]